MGQEFQDKVRYHINLFIFENCFAPSVDQLVDIMGSDDNDIRKALGQLAKNHALVLHPDSWDIWVAHPFALYPTLFWVKSGDKAWWGNCIWCSLGIAAISNEDTEIHSTIMGEEKPVQIDIKDHNLANQQLLVHFAVPASNFWDNVIYTCSNMLLFESEDEISNWCRRHNVRKGEVLDLAKVWELARAWYGNYLDPSWRRKTREESERIFQELGLTSEFWKF